MRTMPGVPVIKSDRFGFNAASRTFHADISDFRGINVMSQLYEDACDQGFILESSKTGRKIPFGFLSYKQDGEGEVQCWTYSAVVGFTTYYVHMWND